MPMAAMKSSKAAAVAEKATLAFLSSEFWSEVWSTSREESIIPAGSSALPAAFLLARAVSLADYAAAEPLWLDGLGGGSCRASDCGKEDQKCSKTTHLLA